MADVERISNINGLRQRELSANPTNRRQSNADSLDSLALDFAAKFTLLLDREIDRDDTQTNIVISVPVTPGIMKHYNAIISKTLTQLLTTSSSRGYGSITSKPRSIGRFCCFNIYLTKRAVKVSGGSKDTGEMVKRVSSLEEGIKTVLLKYMEGSVAARPELISDLAALYNEFRDASNATSVAGLTDAERELRRRRELRREASQKYRDRKREAQDPARHSRIELSAEEQLELERARGAARQREWIAARPHKRRRAAITQG